MSVTHADKIAAVDRLLDDFRWAREQPQEPEHATFHALVAIAADLRAQTPKESSKVLRAMSHQVDVIKRTKAQIGYIDHGQMENLTNAVTGRWWPTIRAALENHERETAEHAKAS